MTIQQDLQKSSIGALVELFTVHMDQFSEPNFYFTSHTAAGAANVAVNGQVYSPIPVEASGFGAKMSGAMPRPKIKISNISKFLLPYLVEYNDLIGVPLTRTIMLEKNLDGGTDPDHTQVLSTQKFLIQQKSNLNKLEVEFILSSVLDVQNVTLPRGKVLRGTFPGAGLYRRA